MEKTVSMRIDELNRQLITDINQSGLPASVIELIFSKIYMSLQQLAAQELKQDVQAQAQEKTEQ